MQNAALADVLINPNLTGYDQYNISPAHAQEMINIGYKEISEFFRNEDNFLF